MPRPSEKALLAALFVGALAVRACGITTPEGYAGDEVMHVPAAYGYGESGQLMEANWYHPPLRLLMLYAGLATLGDTPLGRRAIGVIFGAAAVLLVWLLARELWDDRRRAWLAALIVGLDPLHIIVSQSTFEEVPIGTVFVAATWLVIRYTKRRSSSLLAVGLLLGCTFAMKWYYVLGGLGLVVYAVAQTPDDRPRARAYVAWMLLGIPFIVYLAAFLPWFTRGYGIGELVALQLDALREMRALRDDGFNPILAAASSAGAWFVKPIAFGFPTGGGGWPSFKLFTNNPPVWLWTLPACGFVAWHGWRERNHAALLVLALFAITWLPLVLTERPVFIYSGTVVLPFAALFIAATLARLHVGEPNRLGRATLIGLVLWCLYLYPLSVDLPIPPALYAPIFAWAGFGG